MGPPHSHAQYILSLELSSCVQQLRNLSRKPETIRFTWSTDVKLQRMVRITGSKVPAECDLKSRGIRGSRHVLRPVVKNMKKLIRARNLGMLDLSPQQIHMLDVKLLQIITTFFAILLRLCL